MADSISFLSFFRLEQLEVAALLASTYMYDQLLKYMSGNMTDDTLIDNMNEFSFGIKDTLVKCSFAGKNFECKHLFRSFMTDDGMCFTFNSLDMDDILRR